MEKQKAVALISGGLDSVVSMAVARQTSELVLFVFCDYGQRAVIQERQAVQSLSAFYHVPYQEVDIRWLIALSSTALVNTSMNLPEYTVEELESPLERLQCSAKAVWIPNRNGVMINVAAAYAESLGAKLVVFGANQEEALTFPDNSQLFVDQITASLSFSTANQVQVLSPLAEKTKNQILEQGLLLDVPLHLVWSCYTSQSRHCGKCESCVRLKRALMTHDRLDIWRALEAE